VLYVPLYVFSGPFSWPFVPTYGSVQLLQAQPPMQLLAATILPVKRPSFVISIQSPEEIPKCESEFLFW
jgi:hypothetical protein